MRLTALSLKRPVTTIMFFVCVTVIGILGAQRLPLEFLPDIEFPVLRVGIPYRNSTTRLSQQMPPYPMKRCRRSRKTSPAMTPTTLR